MAIVLFIIALVFAIGAIVIATICGQPFLGIAIAMWVVLEIRDFIRKETD